ncbi:MAG TPA: metallophosphoesterase [Anaerolineaceae bacterium]
MTFNSFSFKPISRITFLFFGFLGLDWLFLCALPWLGLSFGRVLLPFLVLLAVRAFLALVWVGLWGWRRHTSNQGWLPVMLLNLLVSAGLLYACYIEPFWLTTTIFQMAGPQSTNGRILRIVQISDLHVERITPRERMVIDQAATLQPDLIVLTGDYLNLSYLDDPLALRDARSILEQFHAPLGVYAVNGTVDSPAQMQALFTGLDIHVLDDQVIQVEGAPFNISIIGVSDREWGRDAASLRRMAGGLSSGGFSVLLYHNPDLIEVAAEAGVDLYFAGHTHGGQIRVPFYGALVTFSRFGKRYEMGKYRLGKTTLYVSRGLGMEGWLAPRARFLTPPELVVAEIK